MSTGWASYAPREAEGPTSLRERALAAAHSAFRRVVHLRRPEILGVLLATTVGATLRFALLAKPLTFDEATTGVFFVGRTVLDAVTDYTVPNNHILHSVLAHLSVNLFGGSEFALRMPAFLAGVASIPVAVCVVLALLTLAFTSLLYSPVWAVQGWGPLVANPYVTAAGLREFLGGWWTELGWLARLNGMPTPVLGLFAIVFGVVCITEARQHAGRWRFLIIATIAGAFFLTLATRRALPARALTVSLPVLLIGTVGILSPLAGRRRVAFYIALLGLATANLRAISTHPGVLHPLASDQLAAASLHDAIRASVPDANDGYEIAIDVTERASDPARYYAALEGLRLDQIRTVMTFDDLADLSPGTRLVLIRRRVPDPAVASRLFGPFLVELEQDSTLAHVAEPLGPFIDVDAVPMVIR